MRSMSQAEPSAATSSRRSGFTLVEVLVVAPLVILILGALIAVIVVTTASNCSFAATKRRSRRTRPYRAGCQIEHHTEKQLCGAAKSG